MRSERFLLTLAAVILIIPFTGVLSAQEESEPKDYAWLMDLYDGSTQRYTGLADGQDVTIRDEVAISYVYESGNYLLTRVYLVSTGASANSPNLTFPGDLTYLFLMEAKVEITFRVHAYQAGNVSDPEVRHRLIVDQQNVVLLKEGETVEGSIKKDQIDIFGYKIQKEDLPEYLQSNGARFGLAVGIWALIIVIIWFILRVLLLFTKKTKTNLDHTIVRIIRIPFFSLLLIYGVIVSLSQLEVPEQWIEILDMLYRAVAIILVAIVAVKIFRKVIMVYLKLISKKTETEADDVLVPVIGKFVTVVIWILAVIYFFKTFGFDATALLGAMGIAGLVIAFAAQDTLSNFFSGIMILLDRPFKEEDWIILDGSVYQVKHIGLRSTRLFSSWTQQLVTLPNAKISGMMFSNMTEPDTLGRRTVNFSVSYDSDIEKVREVVERVTKAHPGVIYDDDHAILVRFNDFGASALEWAVTYFCKDYNDQWAIASDLRKEMYREFAKEGIEIPFPQRVVHFKGVMPGPGPITGPSGKGDDPTNMKNLSP